jgi:glycosyltransferase involved in cell wall biosynthesis
MRIAFVPAARLLSDRAPNGEALIAVDLLRRLGARGHQITAWCEQADLSAPIDGVEVREVPVSGRTAPLARIAFAHRIAREAAREPFDVAHLLFPFTTASGYTSVSSLPLVVGPVNLPWPGEEKRSEKMLARVAAVYTGRVEASLHRKTLARAARVFATGTSSMAALPSDVLARTVELPFGLDIARFTPAPQPPTPTILFLASLTDRKGAAVLVRAMARVLEHVPAARLLIAGSDPEDKRTYLDGLAATLGISQSVELIGAVGHAHVPALHARASVFCAPSFGEPFGMNVIEAMASGRPVVGTLGGGIADAVEQGRGGALVPQGDHNALADALTDVLAHPARAAAMGAFNRARAEQRYAIDRIVDRIEATYQAVAARVETGVAHGA